MYGLGIERLLGFRTFANYLEPSPYIPKDWKEYQINYRFWEATYHLLVENPNGANCDVQDIEMNGKKLSDLKIPLQDDGKLHEIALTMK